MREHVKADETFVREDVPVAEARERFAAEDQPYKVELIDDLDHATAASRPSRSTRNGPFTDLCRGPHAPSTGRIKAFKLQSVAGAYWRGDADQQMLTRVYGTAFFSKEELDAHLERLELRAPDDHRKLGRELELFMFSELSPGSPFWLPNGMVIWNELSKLWREQNAARGYKEVKSADPLRRRALQGVRPLGQVPRPHVLHRRGGAGDGPQAHELPGPHADLRQRPAAPTATCRSGCAEQGLVHRHEPSGTLHGLMRVRHITQDDAHIFCSEDQIQDEVLGCLDFGFFLYDLFGFEPRLELSTRPDNRIGTDEMWDHAEAALAGALDARGLRVRHQPGRRRLLRPEDRPAHDRLASGARGSSAPSSSTTRCPSASASVYTGADDAEHRPVMIHRALFGLLRALHRDPHRALRRRVPASGWRRVQAIVLPIADRHADAARGRGRRAARRRACASRSTTGTESVGRKIRDAELRKVPYMLVVGDREAESGEVAVRRHGARATRAASPWPSWPRGSAPRSASRT